MSSWIDEEADQESDFSGRPTSPAGNAYILGVILLGIPIMACSAADCLAHVNGTWLMLAALSVLLAGLAPSLGPKLETIGTTLCDVTVFSTLFLLGPEAGVTVAVLQWLTFNCRKRIRRVRRQLFNLAQIAIVASLAGHIFYLTYGGTAPLQPEAVTSPAMLLTAAAACGLYYFLLTSGLLARAAAYSCRQHFDEVWIRCLGKAHLTSAGAILGAVIFLTLS